MSTSEDCSVAGDACTVEVSASQRTNPITGDPEPDPNDHTTTYNGEAKLRPARYWGASADGSRVLFTSRAELTNDANTAADSAENLYEYELSSVPGKSGRLTDLTPENDEGAGVLGLVTASEDGSYVYFVAEGRLTTQANSKGEESQSGKPNLYLYHGGSVTFIATLAPATTSDNSYDEGYEVGGDTSDWDGSRPEQQETTGGATDLFNGPGSHTVRVASDGSLAFESRESLTGYDSEQARSGDCEGESSTTHQLETGRCREVYLYDAGTGKLDCVSCDSSGTRPVGPANLGSGGRYLYDPRNLSENGGRLFFESPDALVPQDSNGLVDVYEWEQSGVGTCTSDSATYRASSEGCVFAISDVAGGYESRFLDATPSGENVFIATKDQLVSATYANSRVNLYDVRVGGGFPEPAAPPSCTNADSCKPPVSPQPQVFGAPASATFSGPGNPPPPASPPAIVKPVRKTVKCAKGRTRNKHGKCVPGKKAKKKAKKARRVNNDRRASS
jgi:hypothetical protein